MAKTIGQLAIDLSVNSGGAFNALANLGIKLIGISKVAETAASAFKTLFGNVVKEGVALGNTSRVTGLGVKTIQQLQNRAEQAGVSLNTLVDTVAKLNEENARIMIGQGNIAPYQKLGINMNTLRDPIRLMDEILAKLHTLHPAFRNALAQELGISKEVLAVYQSKTKTLKDSLLITDKETNNIKELYSEYKYTEQILGNTLKKIVASEDVVNFFKGIVVWVEKMVDKLNEAKDAAGGWIKLFKQTFTMENMKRWFNQFADFVKPIATEIGRWIFEGLKLAWNEVAPYDWMKFGDNEPTPTPSVNPWDSNDVLARRLAAKFGGSNGSTVNVNTTINTSDGPEAYKNVLDKAVKENQQIGQVNAEYAR